VETAKDYWQPVRELIYFLRDAIIQRSIVPFIIFAYANL